MVAEYAYMYILTRCCYESGSLFMGKSVEMIAYTNALSFLHVYKHVISALDSCIS